jgi:2-oxoglutarate ferredoxin oxidoreductase subunit delta
MSRWNKVPESFIIIDQDKCTGCGSCIIICGANVFEIKDKKAVISNLDECLECGNCEVVCQADAIQVHIPKAGTGIIYECG